MQLYYLCADVSSKRKEISLSPAHPEEGVCVPRTVTS